MARKKLKDMTPYERVERHMKGLTNEQAEEIAIKILSQIIAKHIFIRDDFKQYYNGFLERLEEGCKNYVKEHSFEIAMSKVFIDKKKSEE